MDRARSRDTDRARSRKMDGARSREMERSRSREMYRSRSRNDDHSMSQGEAMVLRVFQEQLAGQIEALVQRQTSSALEKMAPAMGPANNQRSGGLIEPFDPDNRATNVEMWVAIIDQLGEINGWADHERSTFMKINLRGRAKTWSSRFESFGLSWTEWKEMLKKAFRARHNYAISLEELVARQKLPTESMSHYYHKKVELCERCDITGERAVSCIIRGLPEELRENAYACNCTTPATLLNVYLAGLENYQSTNSLVNQSGQWRPLPTPDTSTSLEKFKTKNCFYCKEQGHPRVHCPLRKSQLHCSICEQKGHDKKECPRRDEVKLKAALAKNIFEKYQQRHREDYQPTGATGHWVDSQGEKGSTIQGKPVLKPKCERCLKVGHLASTCWVKLPDSGAKRKTPPVGNASAPAKRRPDESVFRSTNGEKGSTIQAKPTLLPKCAKCLKVGHLASACLTKLPDPGAVTTSKPTDTPPKKKRDANVKCAYCQTIGHRKRNCRKVPCLVCGQEGHKAKKCPQVNSSQVIPTGGESIQNGPEEKQKEGEEQGKDCPEGETVPLEKERDVPEVICIDEGSEDGEIPTLEKKREEQAGKNGSDVPEVISLGEGSEEGEAPSLEEKQEEPENNCPEGEAEHKEGDSEENCPDGRVPAPEMMSIDEGCAEGGDPAQEELENNCAEGEGPTPKEGDSEENCPEGNEVISTDEGSEKGCAEGGDLIQEERGNSPDGETRTPEVEHREGESGEKYDPTECVGGEELGDKCLESETPTSEVEQKEGESGKGISEVMVPTPEAICTDEGSGKDPAPILEEKSEEGE